MICHVCDASAEPAAIQGPIAICGACGYTCYLTEDGTTRGATIRDIKALTDEQMKALRTARRPLVRR